MASSYDRIIKATIELMNKKGYHGTSIQMIADKAKISKSTIIHHFNNKEGILLAILGKHVPDAGKRLKEIVDNNGMKGRDKLKLFMQSHLGQIDNYGDIMNLNLRETRYFSSKNKKIYKEIQHEYEDLLRKIVLQIQKEEKHLLHGLDPKIITLALLGMLNSIPQWYKKKGKLGIDEIADQIYRMVTFT
ncbi:MAG: TetR/AcrR family transcriptional regulator [Desulfobacterales bacterium]